MRPALPLDVLGRLGPILSWVEGGQSEALPKDWIAEPGNPFEQFAREPSDQASFYQERSWLLSELPTYSLDSVEDVVAHARGRVPRVRDDKWSPANRAVRHPVGFDLCQELDHLAERYLIWTGDTLSVRSGRMVEIHELGLRLPLTSLIRHAHARALAAGSQSLEVVIDLPESISLLPSNAQGMREVVGRGLSEGHLHMNAVHAAEASWADHLLKTVPRMPRNFDEVEWRLRDLGRATARTLALATALCRAQVAPGDHGQKILAALDRLYFTRDKVAMEAAQKDFRERFKEAVDKLLFPDGSRASPLTRADRWSMRRPLSDRPKRRFRQKTMPYQLGLLHWLDPWRCRYFGLLTRSTAAYRPLHSVDARESCVSHLHLAAHVALVEARYRSPATSRSQRADPAPAYRQPAARFLHSALFRYLVCQAHFWQLAVQQGRTTGLRQFKRYFDSHQRKQIQPSESDKADAVMRRTRRWQGLRVLEGRVAPPERRDDLRPWLAAFAKRHRGDQEEIGLIVHFIKDHDRTRGGLRAGLARPRFAGLRSVYRRQAYQLFRILEQPSLVSPFIVGIDAANLELATPPEVFAPVFRYLRDRPIEKLPIPYVDLDALECGTAIRQLVAQRRLSMTYHVGEEFRHLLSGLRAIDEVLEFLGPRPGDRIGHGTALGLDPDVWLRHIGYQTLVSQQEWLDTLVWLHQLLGPGDDTIGALNIETTIERLGRDLYGDGDSKHAITPLALHDVWRLRQLDPAMLTLIDDKTRIRLRPQVGDDAATWRFNSIAARILEQVLEKVGSAPPVTLLARYWYAKHTRHQGQKLILVDMEANADQWLVACQKAQARVQERIANEQVVVEVNPSVNRVIGPMDRLAEHHIFRLTQDHNKTLQRRLRVTINTDNPGTANTSLAHEYYLLGETLMAQGKPESEMIEWLEWLRKTGAETSFVRHLRTPGPRPLARKLLDRIEKTQPRLRELRGPDACLEALWETWQDAHDHDPIIAIREAHGCRGT